MDEVEKQPPELWHHIVNAYTGLDLTCPKDKLPALSGLATEIERLRPGDQYLAGLWRSTFMLDVLWRRRRMDDWYISAWDEHYDMHNVFDLSASDRQKFQNEVWNREMRSIKIKRDFPEYVAPSWSWASVNTQIEYDKDVNSPTLNLEDLEFARLVDVNCLPKHQNVKGELTSAYVILRGKIALFQAVRMGGSPLSYRLYRNGHAIVFTEEDFGISHRRNPLLKAKELYCFRIAAGLMKGRAGIAKVYGLVLHAIENRDGEYERVGMFEHAFECGKE
jgi:hypothetical protein